MESERNFNVKRLLRMMSLCRAHESEGEERFIEMFIHPLNPKTYTNPAGEPAAFVVEVKPDLPDTPTPPILFSAHVDTVHRLDAPVEQEVIYDEQSGFAYKDDGAMPLGADNAAGCALLLHMIEAKVPGTYIFHRGEECGGVGSASMAEHHAEWLKQFKWAIAFDRRGAGSIITEMFEGRTASDVFAHALADALNGEEKIFDYAPDATGTFTDTANYAHLIPECSNVSVGYDNEHSPNETLDVWHLTSLAARMVGLFRDGPEAIKLPVARQAEDPAKYRWGGYDFMLDPRDANDVLAMGYRELVAYVKTSPPQDVADLIFALSDRINELEEPQYKHDAYSDNRWDARIQGMEAWSMVKG